jgi:hypothetical protein
VALLGDTQARVQRMTTFSRILRVQTTALNGVTELASILENANRAQQLVNDGTFPEQAALELGARTWLHRGVEAARTARAEVVTTDQLDQLQGDINEAFNQHDGERLADLSSELQAWERSLRRSLEDLRRLESGCRSASRSMAVAHRMFQQLMRGSIIDGNAQAAHWVMWFSTHNIDRIYEDAATQYWYAGNDVERTLESVQRIAADASAASQESFTQGLRDVLERAAQSR